MGQFVPKTLEQILLRMIQRVVARTSLTDLNDGSSIKQVLAAAAREDDDIYFQMINLLDLFDITKSRGEDLDERAKEWNSALISRRAAVAATGAVVFQRTGTSGTVTIPIGTQVQVPATGAAPAITFSTTAVGTIAGGATASGSVPVRALVPGVTGNVAANAVTAFGTKPSGVDSVSNPGTFTNGADIESDDSLRHRLVAWIVGLARCHSGGLENAVVGLEDAVTGKAIRFAQIVEDLAPVLATTINGNIVVSGGRGQVALYVDDGAGTIATGSDAPVVVATETILASALGGETSFRLAHYPVDRAAGYTLKIAGASKVEGADYTFDSASGRIKLVAAVYPSGLTATNSVVMAPYSYFTGLVAAAQKVIDGDPANRASFPGYRAAGVLVRVMPPNTLQIVVSANITVLGNYSQVAVAATVAAALSGYVNALGISEDVILAEMVERAMTVAGMADIKFTAPMTNIVILDDQIARLLLGNITIS